MKKFYIFCLLMLSSVVFAQEIQTIALLEPREGDGSTPVTSMERAMVRGELRKAIVNMPGYEAITRADIDQMMKEQDFQRTGMVNDAQIKRMGEMSGADYICISTLTKSNSEFYLEAYLIHVESGRISNPASQYGELTNGKLANMLPVCEDLANELLGKKVRRATQTPPQQNNYGAPQKSKTTQVPQEPIEDIDAPEGAKVYSVYAFGVYGVIGYFYQADCEGTVVEYRVLYKSAFEEPGFQYLGTAPFAYVTKKAYESPLLNNIKGYASVKPIIVENAKDVARIEFRLTKNGNSVIVKPIYDAIIGGGPLMMLPMNKVK